MRGIGGGISLGQIRFVRLLIVSVWIAAGWAGCAGGRPVWVDRPDNSRFPANRYVTAVGSAALSGGEARARSMAEQTARKELGARIRTSVRSVEQVMLTESLIMNSNGSQEGQSSEGLQQSIRATVEETLTGIEILDRYTDSQAEVLFVLAGIDLSALQKEVQIWAADQDAAVVPLVQKARKAATPGEALGYLDQAALALASPPPAVATLRALQPGLAAQMLPEYDSAGLLAAARALLAGEASGQGTDESITVSGLVPQTNYQITIIPGRGGSLQGHSDALGRLQVRLPQPIWTDAGGTLRLLLEPDVTGLVSALGPTMLQAARRTVSVRQDLIREPILDLAVVSASCSTEIVGRIRTGVANCWSRRGWQLGQEQSSADAVARYDVQCGAAKTVLQGTLQTVQVEVQGEQTAMQPARVQVRATGAAEDGDTALTAAVESIDKKICQED